MSDNPDYRYTFLKWILNNFKEFICSLQLKLCGDELFLLNPGLKFTNLEELSLSAFHKSGMFIFTRNGNPGSGISQFFINYQKSGIRNLVSDSDSADLDSESGEFESAMQKIRNRIQILNLPIFGWIAILDIYRFNKENIILMP